MASYHRNAQITPTDKGPAVNIASWTLMCVSILFTGFRIVSNVIIRGQLARDEVLITIATMLAVGQVIALSFMVRHGLGQHQDTLSAESLLRFDQAYMASSILYVATLAASKFSLLFFLGRLISIQQVTFKWLLWASWAIMGSYLVAEAFTLGFQCSLPDTGDYINGKCINLLAFWDFDAVFDTLSSLVILALPIVIVYPLQMDMNRKVQTISAFGFQIPTCVFAIVRLIYLHRAMDAEDHTWHALDWQVWTAVNLHSNIIAANLPCLKIFIEGFQSMLYRFDLATRNDSVSRSNDRTITYGSRSQNRRDRAAKRSHGSKFRPDDGESNAAITTATPPGSADGILSHADNNGNGKGIHRTVEWTVLESRADERHT